MKLIIGLGNPGKQYQFTRHNLGFLVLDHLAEKWGVDINKTKFKSLVGEGFFNGEKILLLKPQTFMNSSGEAVFDVAQFYKVKPEDILVVYDDMDLPVGRLRLRAKGGPGGHNGMRSIIYLLNSENFPRLRIGIGKPNPEFDTIDYVLGKITEDEGKVYREVLDKAVEAIELGLDKGIERAMNTVNSSN